MRSSQNTIFKPKITITFAILVILASIMCFSNVEQISSMKGLKIQKLEELEDSYKRNEASRNFKENLAYRNLQQSKGTSIIPGLDSSTSATLIVIVFILVLTLILACTLTIILCLYKKTLQRTKKSQAIKYLFKINFPSINMNKFLGSLKVLEDTKCPICLQNIKQQFGIPNYPLSLKSSFLQTTKTTKKDETKVYEFPSQIRFDLKQQSDKKHQCRKLQTLSLNPEFSIKPEEENQNYLKLTYCGHLLHGHCLDKWLDIELTCPICREEFSLGKIKRWEKKLDILIDVELKQGYSSQENKLQNQVTKHAEKNDAQRLKLGQSVEKSRESSFLKILEHYNKIGKSSKVKQKAIDVTKKVFPQHQIERSCKTSS